MNDVSVATLRDLCRVHATRAKWAFVRSHAVGRVLNERLALEGTNTLNLRFVTPLDIALRMGAPFLVERGIDPSEEGLGPALIMRLLLDLPEQAGYFRALADQPPTVEQFVELLQLSADAPNGFDVQTEAVEKLCKTYGVPADRTHIHQGGTRQLLLTLTEQLRADAVVMGAISRSGLKGLFLGNTAEDVLDRLHCDLIIVKPEGFQAVLPG